MHSDLWSAMFSASRPLLRVTTAPSVEPGSVRLTVSGELETWTTHLLEDAVLEVLRRRRPSRITVDLAQISFIDPRGVRALLTSRSDAVQLGCQFVVANPSRVVSRLLGILELRETFGLVPPPVVPMPRAAM